MECLYNKVVFNHPLDLVYRGWLKQLEEEAKPPEPEPESMRYELSFLDWALRKHAIEVGRPKLGAPPLFELCQIKILEELGPIKCIGVFDSFPEDVDVSFGRSLAARMVKKRHYELIAAELPAAFEKMFPKPYIEREVREFNSTTMYYSNGQIIRIRSGMYGSGN